MDLVVTQAKSSQSVETKKILKKKLKIKFIFDSILQGIVENEAYDRALINIKM